VTDENFLQALEACTLPSVEFGHAGHVRACYLYLRAARLRSAGFATALDRISTVIRRYAGSLGKPERYHETITVAHVAIIHEHLVECGDAGGWDNFARQNPELFAADLLLNFYPRAQLESDRARRVFMLPRRSAGAADFTGIIGACDT
jgi:hypothetical protein